MNKFAEIILPLALPVNYTYRIPDELSPIIQTGMRVVVPLGKRKLYTGLVKEIHDRAPEGFEVKDILDAEDESPIISPLQIDFWAWLASYYLCSEGEIMNAALPGGLKLESEMVIQRNLAKEIIDSELNDAEFLIVEALEQQDRLSIKEVSEITGFKNPLFTIKELMSKAYVLLEEELKGGYKPRQIRLVKAGAKMDEKASSEAFESLGNAAKQRELLLGFFQYRNPQGFCTAAQLLKRCKAGDSSLKALHDKALLELFYADPKSLIADSQPEASGLYPLNEEQERAYSEIIENWQKPILLHGVTSSGKTEVYSHLMNSVLKEGKQVLYLVPEIALTTQLIHRLKRFFGDDLLVYHSRHSDRDRVETWLKLYRRNKKPALVIGARSSVFLPFQNLGLVIVDEEHENSYRQYEPAPRYHARDSALVLAQAQDARVILGSATPSFESYFNAGKGKYHLVEMKQRFGAIALPEMRPINVRELRQKKQMSGYFSPDLVSGIEQQLKMGKQVILFQNRRGFSTFLQCETCGHVMQCKNCDISLTYHKHHHHLRCHVCGYNTPPPRHCPACKSQQIKSLGFGTEKLEDELELMFPQARIQRMDLDTTRKKKAYENIIEAFEEGETDILVGTQMVTKGLDFENVGLVGIMNADAQIYFPDFRAHEKAFQMLAQVAGRAGRKGDRGLVLIQCSDPNHPVLIDVMGHRYRHTYQRELQERMEFHYPPYYRLIQITLKHRDRILLEERASKLGAELRQLFGRRIYGPEYPLANRLRGMYQMEILLKIETSLSLQKVKAALVDCIDAFQQQHKKSPIRVIYDVDPI
ncbi:MAG: primosomal protein N' [Bacteroidetes bacterium]|nr:primosomal protein N' [Bacteroidota bacterium]